MSDESPAFYAFDRRDRVLLSAVGAMLAKLVSSGVLRPAELVSVAKLQHVLARLPRATLGLNVRVQVQGPRRKFGEVETYHTWTVGVEGEFIELIGGGYFYQASTGGDSFTTFMWSAAPGEPVDFRDYRDRLLVVPGVRPFPTAVDAMDFAAGGYTIYVWDSGNPLLEDLDDEEDAPAPSADVASGDGEGEAGGGAESGPEEWWINPQDAVEESLAACVDRAEVNAHEPQYAYGVRKCDLCKCSLAERGLYVDGALRGNRGWANLCAHCFAKAGAGIGPGVGALFARQLDGRWRLVAGFPTQES